MKYSNGSDLMIGDIVLLSNPFGNHSHNPIECHVAEVWNNESVLLKDDCDTAHVVKGTDDLVFERRKK